MKEKPKANDLFHDPRSKSPIPADRSSKSPNRSGNSSTNNHNNWHAWIAYETDDEHYYWLSIYLSSPHMLHTTNTTHTPCWHWLQTNSLSFLSNQEFNSHFLT